MALWTAKEGLFTPFGLSRPHKSTFGAVLTPFSDSFRRGVLEDSYPFEEGVYLDAEGTAFEVAVKRARSKQEMREPGGARKLERTVGELPWAERARMTNEEGG